jgi:hypothetical protein
VTKYVGPNGVRPWGERRSPLQNAERLRGAPRGLQLLTRWTKSALSGVGTKANSSKLNERTGNVYENKGPAWKTRGQSVYVFENAGTYLIYPGILLKIKELI